MQDEIKGYKFVDELGKGLSSKVFLAVRKKDGEKFAIKRVERAFVNDKNYKKYINNEIYILKNINNEHTIKFIELIVDNRYIYLVFEYCNGIDLDKCLKEHLKRYGKPFSQEVVQYLMRQIVSAFIYLHSRDIIHRDIKLENILVKFPTEEDKINLNMMKAKIKITDFGLARYIKGDKLAQTVLGNPINMDPNIFKKMMKIDNYTSFGYDQKADIWSLGTITYELLIGCPAFEANSYEELLNKIEKGEYRIPHQISLSFEALTFLSCMLRYDPKTRLDIESLSKQHFLTRDVSTFLNMPLKRTNKGLGESIIINTKSDENSGIEDLLAIFEGIENDIDYTTTQDENPYDNMQKGKRIDDDEEDFVGQALKKADNTPQNIGHETKKENFVDKDMTKYLNNLFDEMNKDCFRIEPLLVPIQPIDTNFNSSDDPIIKFMEAL